MSHGPSASGGALVAAPSHASHAAHEPVFVGAARAELDRILARYPSKQAALLPALWMLQDARGWVSEGGMEEVAAALDLTPRQHRATSAAPKTW